MEIRRLISAIDERTKLDSGHYLPRDRLIVTVCSALRSSGNAIILLEKPLRNKVAELINKIDDFSHVIETTDPGRRDEARLNQPLRDNLAMASTLGVVISDALVSILDKEPRYWRSAKPMA